jgi:hypothetical protein
MFDGKVVLNVLIALVIFKVVDKMFLDKAFSSLGFLDGE